MLSKDGKMYHIHCKEGEVGRYVLLPGDPFRTDLIASYLDDAKLVAHNREHKTWTGFLDGEIVITSYSIHYTKLYDDNEFNSK